MNQYGLHLFTSQSGQFNLRVNLRVKAPERAINFMIMPDNQDPRLDDSTSTGAQNEILKPDMGRDGRRFERAIRFH